MILLNCTISSTPWYETSIFGTIIGAVITTVVTIIIFSISNKIQQRNEKKNFLSLILNKYNDFFSLIYKMSITKNDQTEYIRLREELDKNINIIFLLPKDLKDKFFELYKIHSTSPLFYEQNKHKIAIYLKEIVSILDNYGVVFFEDK